MRPLRILRRNCNPTCFEDDRKGFRIKAARMDPYLIKDIDAYSYRWNVSFSEAMRRLILKGMEADQ